MTPNLWEYPQSATTHRILTLPFVTDFKSFFGLKFNPKLEIFDFDWISYDDKLFSDWLFSDPEEDKDDLDLNFVALCLGANNFPVSSSDDFSWN